jgi:hypothetical protein
LVWEDASGTVTLSFNAPEYIVTRHDLPRDLLANIAGGSALMQKAAEP